MARRNNFLIEKHLTETTNPESQKRVANYYKYREGIWSHSLTFMSSKTHFH